MQIQGPRKVETVWLALRTTRRQTQAVSQLLIVVFKLTNYAIYTNSKVSEIV